jgi:hypothetical protein
MACSLPPEPTTKIFIKISSTFSQKDMYPSEVINKISPKPREAFYPKITGQESIKNPAVAAIAQQLSAPAKKNSSCRRRIFLP